jgi:hypothetical protein
VGIVKNVGANFEKLFSIAIQSSNHALASFWSFNKTCRPPIVSFHSAAKIKSKGKPQEVLLTYINEKVRQSGSTSLSKQLYEEESDDGL